MSEFIDAYKRWMQGTPEDQANAHTLAELARYRNQVSRQKRAGTFIPSGAGLEKKVSLIGTMMQQAESNLQTPREQFKARQEQNMRRHIR